MVGLRACSVTSDRVGAAEPVAEIVGKTYAGPKATLPVAHSLRHKHTMAIIFLASGSPETGRSVYELTQELAYAMGRSFNLPR